MELSNSTVTCNTTKTHIYLHKSVLHFTVTHNLQQNDEHKIDVKLKKNKKTQKVFIVTQSLGSASLREVIALATDTMQAETRHTQS